MDFQTEQPASHVNEQDEAAPLPMELTASTALQLWYELMQRAILNGDPLDALDSLGFNFLHYASLEGNLEVVKMLLERGVPVNIVSENHQRIIPLHWACLRAHMDVVLLLLEHGADIDAGDSEGHTPLQKAAQYGQTKLCQVPFLDFNTPTTVNIAASSDSIILTALVPNYAFTPIRHYR